MKQRCAWVTGATELECQYHDEEWGVPVYDDVKLFEALTLEGAQAGLSWRTILNKREGYRSAFDHFNIETVAHYSEAKQDALMKDAGIIRNRLKIRSTVSNAQHILAIQTECGSFSNYLWSFIDHQSIKRTTDTIPATTPISDQLSKSLKKAGFKFVGPTICYAFMQAVGMVNDHDAHCFKSTDESNGV